MAGIYAILLIGLKTHEESFAASHFSRSGHQIITAASAVEAKDRLKSQKIALAYLQASSDENAVQELREIVEHGGLPVVLVCARPTNGLVLEAWRGGAADILFLPLTPQSLDSSLERCARQILSHRIEQAAPIQARFFYFDETGKECWASITSPRFAIGRSSTNNLVLSQMGVSRFHAEVLAQDEGFQLRDLGSKLGTYLNGTRIKQAKLTSGDRVQLGSPQGFSLVFHQGDLLQSLLGASDSRSEISLSVRGFREIGMVLAAFRALSSIPLLDDLLALVVDTAIELTGAERGFIMLKEKNDNLSFRCARNNRKLSLDGSCFRTSHRVPHEVFATGQSIAIKDLDMGGGSESHNSTRQLGLRSIACVPLSYIAVHESGAVSAFDRAETIGVLYVDSQSIGTRLSASRIDALKTLASEAAMAIYNARLYKDSQDKRKMDEQLAIAREIQQALLPQLSPLSPLGPG